MKLELYESRGQLDKIDYSLLSVNERVKNMTDVSPSSVVSVDKLRDKPGTHTWANVIDNILPRDDVAFVVLRSNKRQIALMSKDRAITGSSDRFLMVWSSFVYQIPKIRDLVNDDRYITTESSYNMQTKMWKTVEAYVEYTNGRKNWDIIIVHKDDTLGKRREERQESRKGMEMKPHHHDTNDRYNRAKNERARQAMYQDKRNYKDYIDTLKSSLEQRLVRFVESKLTNVSSLEELKTELNNGNIMPKKIKIVNMVYDYESLGSLQRVNNNAVFSSTYYLKNVPEQIRELGYMEMLFRTEGLNGIVLADVYFKSRPYSDAKVSFNSGVEELITYNKEKANK